MCEPATDVNFRETWYPVVVVYRRPESHIEKLMQACIGQEHCEFIHCELYLPDSGGTFTIFQGQSMKKWENMTILYNQRPELFAWHILPLNRAEYIRLYNWNIHQIEMHCPYNFRDLMWQIVPEDLRRSWVKDISESKAHTPQRMFCSQAIVLALREACDGPGTRPKLRNFVHTMNSRLTTPSDLCRIVTGFLGVAVNASDNVPSNSNFRDQWLQCAIDHGEN
jgi:hypothetical protein